MTINKSPFQDPLKTAEGKERAWVRLKNLKTLWFNTGTLCNLSCANCYIESGPKNDRLVYITRDDVLPYLTEIAEQQLLTEQIAFTGGEPFLNPHLMSILELCLERGFQVLVLTNAYRSINHSKKERLAQLNTLFSKQLTLRISLDHYTQELHEQERGKKTFFPTLECMQELHRSGLQLSVAARTFSEEGPDAVKKGYKNLLHEWQIPLNIDDPKEFVLFPEMDEMVNVPEITTTCWDILGKSPDDVMCASSRMIIKRKGENTTKVISCTLLPYDLQFELGVTLKESQKDVRLNHLHCAKFCVLGGASCSA